MNTESAPQQAVPSVSCPVCGTAVPVGAFCGFCGAHLTTQGGNGPHWLRIRAYGAARAEHVLRVSVVSSLFPHLPHRSRAPFRMGLAGLILAMVVFALLRWQAPLVAVSAVGFALLFLIYLEESDVYGDDDLPLVTMVLAAVLGLVLGIGWALLTGPVAARSFTEIGPLSLNRILVEGIGIPVGGAVLMLVPAVVVRLLRPKAMESLDGYLVAALGTVVFAAAGTMTRLAPQLTTGVVASNRHATGLLIEAGIEGVAVPLTAAAAGGIVGAAMWYTPADDGRRHPSRFVGAIVPAVAAVLVVYAGLGIVDVVAIPQGLQLGLHLLITVIAILALRIGVHLALLHETQEEMHREPLLCAECHHVVPYMAFCPNCGVATRAASRSSRNARRVQPQAPTDMTTEES